MYNYATLSVRTKICLEKKKNRMEILITNYNSDCKNIIFYYEYNYSYLV